jgi:hypothetical protein
MGVCKIPVQSMAAFKLANTLRFRWNARKTTEPSLTAEIERAIVDTQLQVRPTCTTASINPALAAHAPVAQLAADMQPPCPAVCSA